MVKKRVRDADKEVLPDAPIVDQDDSGSDEDVDMVNVEFEFFNMKPEIDFHGIKSLCRQLFDVDAQLFNISELADLILSQPTIGSTVKVDGEETDAYAFLTVLNMAEHSQKPVMADITRYLVEKSSSNPAIQRLPQLLRDPKAQVGLILTERLINVPTELAPPMYAMIIDEIEAAVEDKEPYEFTHYLIVSKTWREITSTLDQEDAPRTKKTKAGKGSKETFWFHPEDEILINHCSEHGGFTYTKEGEGNADAKRAFQEAGIKPEGYLMLIEASKFEGAATALTKYVGGQ